jgi:chromosomal replication initiator protein
MVDVHKIWHETKANLSGEITAVVYSLWVESLYPLCIKNNVFILLAPTLNAKITVNKNYADLILKALNKARCNVAGVEVIIEEEKAVYEIDANFVAVATKFEQKEKSNDFISRYTFENFVEGESNKLVYHAAQSVAKSPGSAEGFISFNPLFIHGGVGIGKTHLLHAVGNYLYENTPHLKVLYVTTEKLTNDYIEAISNTNSSSKSSSNFRSFSDKYRKVDVLMVDDVQFLQKKTGLQEVFFHIFNDLYQHGKQIILTSDRPPKEISTLEDRLRSRFEGGLIADIGLPNLELRMAIIKKKMQSENLFLNDDIIYYLAEAFDSNIRELEGALSKVILYSSLTNKTPDLETAKQALKNSTPKKEEVDSNEIISTVCSYFRIQKNDLIGKKKTKDLVEARMIAIYLITELLSIPLVSIGQIFGGRDHTTIIYSRDKIQSSLKDNSSTSKHVKDIKSLLNCV